jgi:integrase
MKAKDVRANEVKMVLHPIIQRGALVLANRCRSYLMAAFRFGIQWDNDPKNFDTSTLFKIESNPARDVPKPQRTERPAERALSADELCECWKQWGDPNFSSLPAGYALRLILATGGQRVEEVLRAAWSEFNEAEGLWEIPAARTKTRKSHVVPLTQTALNVLDELRPLTGEGELLFPLRKRKGAGESDKAEPMQTNSLGNAVRRFCVRAQKARSAELRKGGALPADGEAEYQAFTARDLRRTVKTLMGKLGVSKELRDRLQNHALTDVSSKHYDRYDYLREKRNAMQTWEVELQHIIIGTEAQSNVRKLRA